MPFNLLEYEEVWPETRPIVLNLLKQEPVTQSEWQHLFFGVHVVCLWDEKGPSKIYDCLQDDIVAFIKQAQMRVLAQREEQALLKAYIIEWRKFFTQSSYLPLPFKQLETALQGKSISSNHNSNNSQKKSNNDESIVRKLMLDSWNQSIFMDIKDRLQDSAMKLVHAERNGDAFDSQLVIGVRESYVNLCSNTDDKLKIYRDNFEKAYLEATQEFYRMKASEQLQQNGVQTFMRYADVKLREEEARAKWYLETSSFIALAKCCVSVLIEDHLSTLLSECPSLIKGGETERLQLMFRLLDRVPSDPDGTAKGIDPMLRDLEKHIIETGLDDMKSASDVITQDSEKYVERLLDLFRRFSKLVKDAFNDDPRFLTARDKAFQQVVNDTTVFKLELPTAPTARGTKVTTPESKCPELLANYCDMLLRRTQLSKKLTSDEIESRLKDVLLVLKYVNNKDVFMRYHKAHLTRRLILDSSADSEKEEDMVEYEILKAITENRYNYNNYTTLINIAHKLNDLEKIRESCNLFSSVFPLAPEIWMKWIIIELKVSSNPEEYENVQKLFRRALHDYYSTDIAIEYAKLAILWDNDEIWDEIVPKYAFNCLKGSKLVQERRNHFKIKLDDSPENIKKMIKIYETECKLPLLEIENVYKEFKEFAEKHETISAAEIDWETVDRRYNRANNTLSKILPFELKLKNIEAKKYGEKERLYLEYIKECEDLLEDDFLQAIYERMMTDCCLSSNVWFEYMEFIDSLSNDSDDEEDDVKQSVFNCTKLDVVERALRNITWNSDFYIEKMRIIGNSKSFEKSKYKDTFEAAIAVGFETPEPLVQIWLEYLTHLRRQTDFKNDKDVEILRKNFDLAWNTLGRQWGVLADQQCEILQFWGHLEYTTLGNMLKGRDLWNTVMESADNSYKTALWIKFIDFETTRNIESARKLYSKAIHMPNLDNYLSLQTAWLSFERVYGNTSTLKNCETICRKIYANLYSTAKSQKREAKPKQPPAKSEISNKRPHPEGKTSSAKKLEQGESQAKRIKTDGENMNPIEIDETKEHLTVFLSNLDYIITESEIATLFPNFKINKIIVPQDDTLNRGRGYSYVEFSNENEVKKALDLDRTLLKGRPTYISPCNRDKNAREKGFKFSQEIEKQKLFVKGVPHDASQEDLEVLFKKFGELKSVRIVYHKNGKSKGIAYIEFKDEKSASKAVLEMDQMEYRDHILVVAISAPPPRPSSNRFEIPFKRIIKSTAKDEMKPRLSFIPQAVQKRILDEKRVLPPDVMEAVPRPEQKTNDYFRNLANKK